MIATVAAHQLRSLRRQGTFVSLLAVFGVMTALAGVLGWSSNRTIVRVYDQATILLAGQGQPAPPNPFDLKPTLSLLSNMVVYVPLIGALLAIIVGHLAWVDDQAGGVGRLVFSRPVDRGRYLAGKLVAAAAVLAGVMLLAFGVSAGSLLWINHRVGSGDLARLLGFYGLSWLYVLVFAQIGMLAVTMLGRRSLGLLSAMGAWLVVTFVIPQFTSALRPTTSLNPLSESVGTSQAFFRFTAHGRPLSIAEQYKAASAQILATASSGESVAHTLARIAPIVGALIVLTAALAIAVRRYDYSRSSIDA